MAGGDLEGIRRHTREVKQWGVVNRDRAQGSGD
jgi:hypothetical protein